jgi:formate-dependent nitrite reductase membrane component NrfD
VSAPALRDDGRHLDPALGTLTGEGATIRVEAPLREYPADRSIERRVQGEEVAADPTYHEQPVLKEPVWIWSVPAYLFVGGLSGAASALGAAAQIADRRRFAGLLRWSHRVATTGEILSAGLLVHDLGRPARFLHMLRVFRPTSPMSVGSWILTLAGGTGTLAWLFGGRAGTLGRIGGAAGIASGILGLPLSGYTGVLLANTAIPVWQEGRRVLPPLFLASSAGSAGSLLSLLPTGPRGREAAARFGLFGHLAAFVLGAALEREIGRGSRAARPLGEGLSGALWAAARALAAGSVLGALAGKRRVAAGLGLAGSLSLRTAVFLAGRASARDPRATFHTQRARLAARS